MKYSQILRLGVMLAALVLAGCAKSADTSQVGDTSRTTTATTPSPVVGNVAQLKNDWTLINFGAPW
jgi:PBP1b-binding outer membrane lipoprotein LpoB